LTGLSRVKEEEEGKKRKCWRERPAMCVAFCWMPSVPGCIYDFLRRPEGMVSTELPQRIVICALHPVKPDS
jgi:hypothetical protein